MHLFSIETAKQLHRDIMKGECTQALHMLAPSILLSYIRVCDDKQYLQKRNTELVEENRKLKKQIKDKHETEFVRGTM